MNNNRSTEPTRKGNNRSCSSTASGSSQQLGQLAALFEEQGYTTLAPGWPDDPDTVEEAKQDPEVFAHKRIKQVTDHYIDAIRQLKRKPAVIGHSFGGLIAQKVAGEGVAAVTVAIDPAPFRGVLPLPLSALKSSSAVLGNPLNYTRAVPLTYEQFRFAFANAVDESEAHELYETYSVPGSGAPLFQAATANLNPWTEARVDTKNPERGPLLIISGETTTPCRGRSPMPPTSNRRRIPA